MDELFFDFGLPYLDMKPWVVATYELRIRCGSPKHRTQGPILIDLRWSELKPGARCGVAAVTDAKRVIKNGRLEAQGKQLPKTEGTYDYKRTREHNEKLLRLVCGECGKKVYPRSSKLIEEVVPALMRQGLTEITTVRLEEEFSVSDCTLKESRP